MDLIWKSYKKMNSKKIIYFSVLIGLLCMAPIALAQISATSTYTTFPALLAGIASQLGTLIASLGAVMIIVAGIFYLTSAGSPERVGVAKKTLMYAIIGIVVGLTANAITSTVTTIAGGTDVKTIINSIASQLGTLIVSLATVMIVVAGGLYLTSAGSPERMGVAKKAIVYAIVGIILGILAPSIVTIITNMLGV
jgi:hypothetical protein